MSIHILLKDISTFVSTKYNLNEEDVLSSITQHVLNDSTPIKKKLKTENFKQIGKFKTLRQLKTNVSKAKSKGKWCNVSTSTIHSYYTHHKKYEMFECGLSGLSGSEELKYALSFFKNKNVSNIHKKVLKLKCGKTYICGTNYLCDEKDNSIYARFCMNNKNENEEISIQGLTNDDITYIIKHGWDYKNDYMESDIDEGVEDVVDKAIKAIKEL